MAQPQMLQIKLSRFDAQPWGFRLQGGVDFAAPLLVQKVNGGSLAEQAGLQPGDAVLMINDVDVFNLKHKDAQDIVVRSGNNFVMTIQRGGSTWKPHVTPTGNLPQPNSPYLQTVTKTSLAHHQPDSQHIGCGYNNSARPFANGGGDGNVKSIVNKQYNTPVGIYSEESIAETLSAQAEVLAGGVLGVNFKKNEKEYQADKSEVLKFLREEESGQSSTPAFISEDPTQQEAHYQQKQQQQQYQQQQQHQHQPQHQYQPQQQQQNYQQQQQYQPQQQQQQQYQQQQQNYQQQQSSATRHVSAPVNTPKPPSTGGLPTGQNICTECERLITGVFVRIKDKNLHVECFRCATCGTSLKNQGYYNFNNKLYCDVHAKLAALQNPPSGTDGYVPVPIKPNTKLSANTISSALNAHGYNNGVSNGNSTPTPAPVNQGYARPFGASAGGPPAGAPKSPMSYPPQQQQQQQQQWNQPQPAGNNYATLPRAAAGGQQAPNNPSTNTNTELNNATLPRKPGPLNKPMKLAEHQPQVPDTADNATAMLTESLSKLDVDNKMGQNFMAEAGKIISNMLEARLAGNHPSGGSITLGQSLSHGGSAQSMHSNNSGSTRSPMVVRKRLDLDDFKNLDPTKPVALHPVVVANVTPHLNATADQSFKSNAQIAQPQQKPKTNGQSLTNEMPNNHAMGKLLDMCDNKPTLLKKPTTPLANSNNNKMPVFQPIRKDIVQPKPIAMPLKDVKVEASATEAAMHSPVVLRQTGRGNGERSTHAIDRRSYIEAPPSTATNNNNTVLKPQATPAQPQALAQAQTPPKPAQPKSNNDNAPAFCVSVKALNGQDENTPMSAENEQVVSQFLKDGKKPICCQCDKEITSGPFITALGRIWCPDHFICVNGNCRRPLQDIGFVEEKGDLYCEYCFEKYLAPTCSKCNGKIKGDCLNAIGRHFHPECFSCTHCGKVFGNSPFFLEEGNPYCEADWNELFTTKCFACGFPVEAGDRWVEALNHNYHSQCFNCTFCKQNLEGQSFYNKGGRPFCKNHAR